MVTLFGSLVFFMVINLLAGNSLTIEEESYNNRPHFVISTQSATYYLDRAGGGLSSIIDRDGTDWIHYNGSPHAKVPDGASGGFRGLPNFVFRSDDGGAGHPGFDQCISEQVDGNTIRTQSKSGKWAWSWRFYDDHVELTMERTDPGHSYWFLYEGPVAGSFDPYRKYWGTDLGGPRYEVPSLNQGESIADNWRWAYFGDQATNRIFFVAQQEYDLLNDIFSYMGNSSAGKDAEDGMVVFGFGRGTGAKSLMTAENVTFRLGFLERKIKTPEDHEWVAAQIRNINNPK